MGVLYTLIWVKFWGEKYCMNPILEGWRRRVESAKKKRKGE